MQVRFDELAGLAGQVNMVDGCFDPLHHGHIAYFRAAAALGLPLLCNVAGDTYLSTKHAPFLRLEERVQVIDALAPIAYVHASQVDTVAVLRALRPRTYVKGSDWRGRLPEDQVALCREMGIAIHYTDTVLASSSTMLAPYLAPDTSSRLAAYEDFVLSQRAAAAGHYDAAYFADAWRTGGGCYSLESRRAAEGRNPVLIRDVFAAERIVDMGCGPGALMCLLDELGVRADGVDFSEDAKRQAPEAVRARIRIGSITDVALPDASYDLVICREVLEHMTVLDVRRAVANMCRISARYVYLTTRFHPAPTSLFDVTTELDVDPTHITLMNIDMLRLMFVLHGFRRRADLEKRMDWLNKGRVLVYEKA